jgi:KDO2-lipid IV(A) lauroyltransferase
MGRRRRRRQGWRPSHLLEGVALGGRWLPEPLVRSAAAPLGAFLARRGPFRRQVRDGLATAFARDLDEARRLRLAAAVYEHFVQLLWEIGQLGRLPTERIAGRVRLAHIERFDAALAEGRGAIMVSGHVGNWLWGLARLAHEGYPLTMVSRQRGASPKERYLEAAARRHGLDVISQRDTRACLRALREGRVLVLVIDRRVRRTTSVCVPFFGQPATSVTGPARLALATGAPVLHYAVHRVADGRFEGCVDPPLPLIHTGDRERDVWVNTAGYHLAIEQAIRRRPEQWIWHRRRWRLRTEPGLDYEALVASLPRYLAGAQAGEPGNAHHPAISRCAGG